MAYAEMKDYDFYIRFGHGDLQKYVQDYAKRIQTNATAATARQTKR